jgi:hypothetical protein
MIENFIADDRIKILYCFNKVGRISKYAALLNANSACKLFTATWQSGLKHCM